MLGDVKRSNRGNAALWLILAFVMLVVLALIQSGTAFWLTIAGTEGEAVVIERASRRLIGCKQRHLFRMATHEYCYSASVDMDGQEFKVQVNYNDVPGTLVPIVYSTGSPGIAMHTGQISRIYEKSLIFVAIVIACGIIVRRWINGLHKEPNSMRGDDGNP